MPKVLSGILSTLQNMLQVRAYTIIGVNSQISKDHRFECQNRELDCVIRNVLFNLINF